MHNMYRRVPPCRKSAAPRHTSPRKEPSRSTANALASSMAGADNSDYLDAVANGPFAPAWVDNTRYDEKGHATKLLEKVGKLKNHELVAVSQDPLGMPGRLISQRINTSEPFSRSAARHTNIVEQVFARPLPGGRWAAALP